MIHPWTLTFPMLERVISPEPAEGGSSVDQEKEYDVEFSMSATEVRRLVVYDVHTCTLYRTNYHNIVGNLASIKFGDLVSRTYWQI